MPLTPEDVQKKQFSTVRFKEGYDEEEVDAFLDEVEAELRRLLADNQSLSRVAQAAPGAPAAPAPAAPTPAAPAPAAPTAPSEDPSETALRTLLLAQRTADEAIAQAKAEAEQVVAQARTRAGSIESEAQQQNAAAMAELQRQRETFERQIDNLRAFEREYRTRLKAYLEGQLRDLESRTAEPASPPPAASVPATPAAPPLPPPPAASSVPPVAPPARSAAPGASPFTPGRPLEEDVDSGSDTPVRPPREADDGSDIESGSTDT
jgi:DivIVA domain-containing protein